MTSVVGVYKDGAIVMVIVGAIVLVGCWVTSTEIRMLLILVIGALCGRQTSLFVELYKVCILAG